MTIEQLLILILCAFLIVLFFGTLLTVYLLGKRSIKDNPKNGRIFVKTGSSVNNPKKAKFVEACVSGSLYRYGNKFVMIPATYSEIFYNNCRMIFVEHIGQLIASPFDKDVSLSNTESESLIYELCASHIGADGMRALKGNKTTNLILIAIIAFGLGAILAYGITQYMTVTAQQQAITIEEKQTEQKLIEVE